MATESVVDISSGNTTGHKCATKILSGAVCNVNDVPFPMSTDNQCADGTACFNGGTVTCDADGNITSDPTMPTVCSSTQFCDPTVGKCVNL